MPKPVRVVFERDHNPNLLALLKASAKVEFSDGFYLQGDLYTGYIQVGHKEYGKLGLWSLDRQGLRSAMSDISYHRLPGDFQKKGEDE